MIPHKVLLVDGNSLLFRSFFVLPDTMRTASGIPTNGLYGFLRMVLRAQQDWQPEAVIVALDRGRPFREKLDPTYKATRPATAEDLVKQIKLFEPFVQSLGMIALGREGFEADDVIGALAGQSGDSTESLILTGDRDLLQLLRPGVTVLYVHRRGVSDLEIYDADKFRAEYGFDPEHLPDYKALVGDTSDNIKGVPGIGDKTARTLLQKCHTIEGILDHIPALTPKMRTLLHEHREQMFKSRVLATIRKDVGVSLPENLQPLDLASPAAREMLEKLEFWSVLKQATAGEEDADKSTPELMDDDSTYRPITEIVDEARKTGALCLIHFDEGPDLAGTPSGTVAKIDHATDLPALAVLWGDSQLTKLTFDAKHFYNKFKAIGVLPQGEVFDTLIAGFLLDPEAKAEFNELVRRMLQVPQPAPADAIKYINHLEPILRKGVEHEGLNAVYHDIELPVSYVLGDMETRGIRIQPEILHKLSRQFGEELTNLEQTAETLVGRKFNLNSPKQVAQVLFEDFKLPQVRKTSTDISVLEQLKEEHPLVPLLIRYRTLAKLQGTYVEALPQAMDAEGKVHTTFSVAGAATGRFSSRDPNLQQVPVRGEKYGREIRSAFVPSSPGLVFLSADYSQIDLRLLAHLSGDENLIAAFRDGQDIHTKTAMEVFGLQSQEVTPEFRKRAKAINFGIIYGLSDFGLSRQLGIKREEARDYIERYLERYPKVKLFIDETLRQARTTGAVSTLLGRRRRISALTSQNAAVRRAGERIAMNTPVQGSSADVLIAAMVGLANDLHGKPAWMLLQVHDELLFEIEKKHQREIAQIIRKRMEHAMDLRVPLTVEVSAGDNWGELEACEAATDHGGPRPGAHGEV